MAAISWLHLSDWHQKGADFDRKIVRDGLLNCIENRADVDSALAELNFVVFSGDVAFHGRTEEYRTAKREFFEPLLSTLKLDPKFLFVIPGNHDLDREIVSGMLPPGLQAPPKDTDEVNKWLTDEKRRTRALEPFEAFSEFVQNFTGQESPAYASLRNFDINGRSVGLLGLNSAWMCGRNCDAKGEVNDYGKLAIGEPQIHDALKNLSGFDVRIVVNHHPFNWLTEFDQGKIENRLHRATHFILSGHLHVPKVQCIRGTSGDCILIPGGAAYDRREPTNSRYANAFNFVRPDLVTGKGVVHLMRWSDPQNAWIADTDTYADGAFDFTFPKTSKPSGKNFVLPSKSDRDRSEIAAKRYRELLLESCDIIDLANLPDQDRHLAQRQLELRRLYVPLRVWVEAKASRAKASQEVTEETWNLLEERRQVIWGEQREIEGEKRDRTSVGERLATSKHLVVLGDPGSGKTTLTRWIATAYLLRLKSETEWKDLPDIQTLPAEEWLPIIVRCRDLDAACLDGALDDVLKHTLRKAELTKTDAEAVHDLLRDRIKLGTALLMLDGLDEISDPIERSKFCGQLEAIASAHPELPIVVTSRIVGYREMGRRLSKRFEHLTIADLTPEEKDQFAVRWCDFTERPERRNSAAIELKRDIHSSDRIERLTGNPMLLTTMALVKRKVGKLPQRRAELYGEAVQVLLNWRSEVDTPIDPYEALPQLEYLSYAMCDRGVQRLREDEVLSLLDQMRREYPNVHAIHQRPSHDFLRSLERRTGILIEAGRERYLGMEKAVYEFRHLTFQEYLAARAIVDGYCPERNSTQSISQQIGPLAGRTSPAAPDRRFEEPTVVESWREALRLCTAICKNDDVDGILQAILRLRKGENSLTERARAIQASLCLLDEPNASDVAVREIAAKLAALVSEDEPTEGGLYEIITELGTTRWEPIIREALLTEYVRSGPKGRGATGSVLANIEGTKFPKTDAEQIATVDRLEAKLRCKDGHDAVIAALAIMQLGFERSSPPQTKAKDWPKVSVLTETLFDCLNSTAPLAHAAAWALGWVMSTKGGLFPERRLPVWRISDRHAKLVVKILENDESDPEVVRWLMVVAGKADISAAIPPICAWLERSVRKPFQRRGIFLMGRFAVETLGQFILRRNEEATKEVTQRLTHDRSEIRQLALGMLIRDLDSVDKKLLSEDLDTLSPHWDPAAPITGARMKSAAKKLKMTVRQVASRYQRLATRFGLIVESRGKNR